VLQSAVVLLAVWWVWVYTTWVTNWLDPDKGAVRWMLLALMLLGLLLSTSIPEAFGARALLFVIAYLAMQIGRGIFTIIAMARVNQDNALNVVRLTVWFVVSGVFWVIGAVVGNPTAQLSLWAVALVIEYLGPLSGYFVIGLGRTDFSKTPMRGGHFAERAALFVIIAIGESVLVTGSAFTAHAIDAQNGFAFLAAFTGSILLWLLYFNRAEAGGSRFIRRHESPTLIASGSYTYLHVILVGGIVLCAVADELVLAHPGGQPSKLTVALIYGAPLLYLVGNLFFKRSVGSPWLVSHLVGASAIAVLGTLALLVPLLVSPLGHAWIANLALAGVVIGEELGYRRGHRTSPDSIELG
jgi:low temperature requirement protein LtrA